jgi:tetrahydromethanopterin S-methyltransferase subunit E
MYESAFLCPCCVFGTVWAKAQPEDRNNMDCCSLCCFYGAFGILGGYAYMRTNFMERHNIVNYNAPFPDGCFASAVMAFMLLHCFMIDQDNRIIEAVNSQARNPAVLYNTGTPYVPFNNPSPYVTKNNPPSYLSHNEPPPYKKAISN